MQPYREMLMDGKEIAERFMTGRIGRRDFNKALGVMGLSMAATLAPRIAAAAPSLTMYGWAGYDVPELHPQYIEKYGASPEFAFFGSEEEALQKLVGGYNVDIIHPCSYNLKRWRDAGVIQPIDVSRLSNWPDIWPKFQVIPQAQFEGKEWFVPFDCGNSSVLYRTDLVDPEDVKDPSWTLLFNEKYKGRLSMYNTDTTMVEIAARILGMYDDYLHLNEDQLKEVQALLSKQRDLLRFYWDDSTQVEQGLASGELVAAYAWNGSVKVLRDQGIPVDYMVPKEGILIWVCGFVRGADAPGDEQAAYDFMDSMISPEAGAFLLEQQGYGHSNRKSYERVSKEVLASLGYDDPEATFATTAVSDEAEDPYRARYIELVDSVKAGTN
ncbi:MAG: PotD/PotF family extracellular solute-binding protein [Dongiaceae bacterium]